MRAIFRIPLGCLAALLSWAAHGQTLDFDGVCPTAPCAIGALYSASGVNFSPNTTQIVPGPTNGLTGPTGAKYLSIAAFPYQITITLARQATSFSMQLSRASTSSGALTVAVTWLKAGVPVATTNVTLASVDIWSTVSAIAAGGFDSIFLAPSGGANATFGIDGLRIGGTCNGFADVMPTDSFCNASEWLANRNVTLGCLPGQYCPASNVNRAQMALFMQRLGEALSPVVLRRTCLHDGTYVPVQYECARDHLAAFPRVAVASYSCGIFGFQSMKVVKGYIVVSTDAGATWSNLGNGGYGTGDAGWETTVSQVAALDLAPGVNYRFAIALEHKSGNAAEFVNGDCSLVVQVHNRNPVSAPFDTPDLAPPPRR